MPPSTAAPEAPPQVVSIPGVELCKVGNWNASQGDGNITAEDIAAMVSGYGDPLVDQAPLKFGHVDPRFDGEPSFGWVENVRASDDGQTLLGDLVGIPSRLAAIIPAAFRKRSVEMVRGKRVGGKVHRALLTGLALLGVAPPAVKGLADVLALYADTTGDSAVFTVVDDGDTPTIHLPAVVLADGDPNATPPDNGGTVTTKITPQLRTALGVPENATDEQINEALRGAGLALLPEAPATQPANTDGQTPATGDGTPAGAPATQAPAADAGNGAPAAGTPVAASAPNVVTVDAAAFSALQADAAAGRAAFAQQTNDRRDGIVADAVRAGKVHPTSAAHYRALLDSDETATVTLLTGLPAVLPVTEVGHAGAGHFSATDPAADTARVERAKAFLIPGYTAPNGA